MLEVWVLVFHTRTHIHVRGEMVAGWDRYEGWGMQC